MSIYPRKYYGSFAVYPVISAAVFLLCWLYGAYRMGRFKKRDAAAPGSSLEGRRRGNVLIACGAALVVLICLFLRFLFL
jgi:hypothetical protein